MGLISCNNSHEQKSADLQLASMHTCAVKAGYADVCAYLASLAINVHEKDKGLLAALRWAALNPSNVDVMLPEVLKDLYHGVAQRVSVLDQNVEDSCNVVKLSLTSCKAPGLSRSSMVMLLLGASATGGGRLKALSSASSWRIASAVERHLVNLLLLRAAAGARSKARRVKLSMLSAVTAKISWCFCCCMVAVKSTCHVGADLYSLSAHAQLLADTGREEEAQLYFERAITAADSEGDSCAPALGLTFGWYALMMEGRGQDGAAKAEQLYRRALQLKPQDPLSMGNYAVFLHRVRRDHKAADAAYRAAVEAHPKHASILCRYGSFLKHVRRDPDKAQCMFEAAIAANPEHAESLGHLAVLLHGVRGDYEGAAALYERAVQCDSHNVNNLSNYGLFLAEYSVPAQAVQWFRSIAISCMLPITVAYCLPLPIITVLLDSGLGDAARAEAMYRRCLAAAPKHSYALYNLAVLVEEQATEVIIKYWVTRALGHQCNSSGSANHCAMAIIAVAFAAVYLMAGNYDEARELFKRAIAASPGDALALADYGRFLANVDRRYDEAQQCLETALKHDPCCPKHSAALPLQHTIATSTHNCCSYTSLSLLCALPLLLSVSALFNLGKLMLSQRQDTAAAADLFTRCTLVKCDHAGAHHCLGRMLLEAGKGDCQSMKQKGTQNVPRNDLRNDP
eukprot:8729-Heterococcus_DN1.PRE.1